MFFSTKKNEAQKCLELNLGGLRSKHFSTGSRWLDITDARIETLLRDLCENAFGGQLSQFSPQKRSEHGFWRWFFLGGGRVKFERGGRLVGRGLSWDEKIRIKKKLLRSSFSVKLRLKLLGGLHLFYHLESRWRNSHVLVYHGPLQIATFWEWLAIYFHYGLMVFVHIFF